MHPVSAAEKAVGEETYKLLQEADSLLRKGQPKQALSRLNSAESKAAEKPFDNAVIQQYYAYAYAEANDFQASRRAAKAALDSQLLDADAQHGLHYLIGQAAFRLESFRESARYLEQWLQKEPKADADIYYMAGYAAYRADMNESATRLLEKAIAEKKSPPAEWTQLLLSIYIERKAYSKAEPLVKKLIALNPEKGEWWRYLSSLYAQLNRHDQALSTLMLAYYIGALRPDDFLQLVKYNAQQGYPAKAARLLEVAFENGQLARGYQNLKLLFGCWQLAREHGKARKILDQAAALSTNGEDHLLSGRIAMQQGEWSAAKDELQKSLRKGGLKRKDYARLWLGIAAFKAQDESLAKQSLESLLTVSSVKKEAAFWLKRIEKSKQRRSGESSHS
ncbi:MAG: hypothetical protein Kow0065_02190 [Methylomicrobium sp.]